MYKHILVAMDDSDTSLEALKEAIKLAQDQKAKLRILHIAIDIYTDYSGFGMGVDLSAFEPAAREASKKILHDAEKLAHESNVECNTQLIELKTGKGRIEEKIVEVATSWPADLLIIGTHGRRGFSHFLLGSVAEGITRIATMPVLLIKKINTNKN